MGKKQLDYIHNYESVYLCDMRPGFVEGGHECDLPPGLYRLELTECADNGGRGFSLLLSGASPDTRVDAGLIEIDGARIGVFNRQALLQHFDDNFEELFEWSDSASGDAVNGAIEISPNNSTDLNALVVDVQRDSQYRIVVLKSGSRNIGVEVEPAEHQKSEEILHKYTRVDVKFIGIGEPWCYFDDWNYEPSLSDVVDSLILEQSIDLGLSTEGRGVSRKIGPTTELRDGITRFRGVKNVSAFLEQGQDRAKRIPLPKFLETTSFPADTTFEQLGEIVYSILLHARS